MVKVCIIATAAIESPPREGNYSGVEAVSWSLAEGLCKLGDNVTLVTTNESPHANQKFQARNDKNEIIGTLEVRSAGPTSWSPGAEKVMFQNYVQWLTEEFGDGQGVVIDMSWSGFPYVLMAGKLGLKPHPNMKIMHVCHALANWFNPLQQKFSLPPVPFPRMCGVSSGQAAYLSSQYGVPVRYIHNGINLPPRPETVESDGYLLSLNRIAVEKGINHCIDVALRSNIPIRVVGADSWVPQEYVADVVDKCHFSNGLAQYWGHVDAETKWNLIRKCKAVISCPDSTRYLEAFGIWAVETGAMMKPVVTIKSGGLNDIIQNGVNGYLCDNTDQMVDIIRSGKLDDINPENCRIGAERFSVENMANEYQRFINGIMSEDNQFKW